MKRLKNNLKSIGGVFTLLLLQLNTFGQDVAADATKPETIQIPEVLFDPITYLWILLGSIVLLTIYTMSHTIKALSKVIEGRVANVPEESEEAVGMQAAIKTSLYKRIMHSLVKTVPIEKEKDVMLDHNYDGIQELDNQLPPWWKYGFYLTIVFAFVYLINFHVSGSGKLQLAEYNEVDKDRLLSYIDSIPTGKFTFVAVFEKKGNQMLNIVIRDNMFLKPEKNSPKDKITLRTADCVFSKDVFVIE